MGNNPIPPRVIRNREDRALALARQHYLDGHLTIEQFEARVAAVLVGHTEQDWPTALPIYADPDLENIVEWC